MAIPVSVSHGAFPCQSVSPGVELLLPTDVVVADKFDPNANSKVGAAVHRGFRSAHC
jgi:hypothetical protein